MSRSGDSVRDLACSFFYLGHAPVASGTFGSLGAFVLCLLIPGSLLVPGSFHFGLTASALALFFFLVGVPLGTWAEAHYGTKDPKPFVLDEVMGFFVCVARPDAAYPDGRELIAGFLLFRLFDILKPIPARQFERLSKGWGIMLDDVVAGLYAWVVLWVLRTAFGW
ncbi:MAG: phosphatidylglycerophosphatase A [Planctomycetota bacterium]